MYCPKCGEKTKVNASLPEVDRVTRYRVCLVCGWRFNTVEIEERSDMHMGRKPTNELEKCPFNCCVECPDDGRKCNKCGWNPAVDEKRRSESEK